MRRVVPDLREDDPSLLPGRQLVHRLGLHRPGAAVPSEEGPNLLDGFRGHDLLLEEVEGGHGEVEDVLEVLGEAGDFQVLVALDGALGGLELLDEKFHQGGLPRPVGPDEADPRLQVDPEVHVVVKRVGVRVRERDLLDRKHGDGEVPRVGEGPVVLGVGLGLAGEALLELLGEELLAGLGLPDHLHSSVPETSDEILDLGDVALSGFGFGFVGGFFYLGNLLDLDLRGEERRGSIPAC